MSKRRVVLVLALVIGAVAAVPVVALAWGGGDRHDGGRSGGELLIGFDLQFTGPSSTAGTFVASGEVGDAGTSTVTGLTLVPFGSRDKARLSGRQEFAGENGTIVTEFDGIASGVSSPHQYGQGRFWIVSGTGDYAGARGGGRFTIVVDAVGNRLIGTEEGRVRLR
jgi:hypothetical protein